MNAEKRPNGSPSEAYVDGSYREEFEKLEQAAESTSPGVLAMLDAYAGAMPRGACWQNTQLSTPKVARDTTHTEAK